MKFKNLPAYVTFLIFLISCSSSNNLKSGRLSDTHTYKVNSYFGCCGCEAKYITINNGKKPIQQIIYSYNCYNEGPPTKYIFNYNAKKQIVSCEKYIATINNDYTLILTDQEKYILSIIKSDSALKPKYGAKELSEIQGFRKPLTGEITHSFPLIKNGTKLTVN